MRLLRTIDLYDDDDDVACCCGSEAIRALITLPQPSFSNFSLTIRGGIFCLEGLNA